MNYKMRNKVSPKTKSCASSIEEALRPLVRYNQFLGLTVFEIPAGKPWPKLSILYVLIKWIIYGLALGYIVIYVDIQTEDNFTLMMMMVEAVLYSNIGIAVISTYIGLKNYKKWEANLKKITLADETLEVFGIDPEYGKAYKETNMRVLIWVGLGVTVFISSVAIFQYHTSDWVQGFIMSLIFQAPLIINPTVDLNFAILINMMGKRFERLNAVLSTAMINPLQNVHSNSFDRYQTVLKRNEKKVAVKPSYYYENRNNIDLLLKVARQLHLDLCATSREINSICCLQMSMQMGATFLLMTGFSYCLYILYNLTEIPFADKAHFYTIMGEWMVLSAGRTLYVVYISVYTMKEAEKSSRIAQEITIPSSQKSLIDDIHQFSLQIMQHPICFSASGLIVLDFSYIRGFAGSVVTYLMILIQNQRDIIKVAHTLSEVMDRNGTNTTTETSFE